jgi:hypothetical protein
MATFISDGLELAYDDIAPEGYERTILLVHGYASNRKEGWRRTGWFGAFERRRFRCIALDQRGHGESAGPHDASAYEREKLAGDGIFLGGEHRQGGEQLPVNKTMVGGKQPYKRDAARHQVPNGTGMMATIDNPGAATAIPTDEKRAPGGNGAKYPAKGVLKTAGQSVMEKIEARKAEMFGETEPVAEEPAKPEMAAKTASAVNYVLDKIAEYHGGGETLDDKSAPVPSNAGRELIGSNAAVVAATKKKAFSARKAELAQVLTEPAQSKASDSKVHENLRNADKGGVKIAAAKALLQKIASEGCGCGGSGECRSCRLSKAIEARQASKQ